MKKETRNPFVGIAPFIEDDYERFFGRDSEKAVALRYIESYRITVLTGPSGCGKTSLVHSGIVHALRMRWREKRHNSLGLPLVIRSWGSGAVKEGGLDELGVQGLFTKILIRDNPTLFSSPEQERVEENFSAGAEAAAEWLAEHSEMKKELSKRSAEIASGNVGDKYAFKVIVDVIARACKGAVVIFDQFEEILRVGEPVVNQVSALIAHLVSLENVRVVLSLRQEHLGDLKYIERNVTPLGKSTIHLEIMPLPTAKDALDRMGSIWAHKNGYKGFEVAAEMLRALRPSAGVDDGADLIYYQAILLQMWECLYGKERYGSAQSRSNR